MQYVAEVRDTLNYFIEHGFSLYMQWLNPGYSDDGRCTHDKLGIVDIILAERSVLPIRDARGDPQPRVQEIREFIYGWARYRDLIVPCSS
jgi:hypothetical protein